MLNYLFTGRVDCTPKLEAGPKHQYLASKIEDHPNAGFNGRRTVRYFKKTFGFTGRQALALMGAHTLGRFNQVTSNIDYSWVRFFSNQTTLLNNMYYRVLTQQPMYNKDGTCVGKMSK